MSAPPLRLSPFLSSKLFGRLISFLERGSDRFDETVEHICFLADVNRLFDNALGLYNLQLALLIAQQSQKDPREYVPFLQNFQRMEPLRRQYSIDDHLDRHKKALKSLYDLNAFVELKSYVSKYALYEDALGLYRYKEAEYSGIMHLYAEHLKSTSRFQEAATAFQYLNFLAEASESYRLANLWQESIACASLIPLSPDQLQSLAESLAQTATETKSFHAAATIYIDYLHDVPSAAKNFCKGYHFADAFRVITLHNQHHLLESVFDAGLAENMATMTDLLADCKAQLQAQVPRIRELRTKKAEDPLAFLEGDANDGKDVPDDVSLAPTDTSTAMGGSLFTRYTGTQGTVQTKTSRRSGKSRRKEERKRARGKKGSVYEEEYLVNSLGRLVERVNNVREEIKGLIIWLVRRKMTERARAVEGGMVEVVGLCEWAIGEVWGKDDGKGTVMDESGGGDDKAQVKRPEVKPFAKLSFLGHGQ